MTIERKVYGHLDHEDVFRLAVEAKRSRNAAIGAAITGILMAATGMIAITVCTALGHSLDPWSSWLLAGLVFLGAVALAFAVRCSSDSERAYRHIAADRIAGAQAAVEARALVDADE